MKANKEHDIQVYLLHFKIKKKTLTLIIKLCNIHALNCIKLIHLKIDCIKVNLRMKYLCSLK